MKNYQKNPKNLFIASSCMFEQLTVTVYDNLNKWHLKCLIWILNLNLWFKPTSFNLVACCISSINSILPCHDHASYCCIALIVFLLYCRCLSPLCRRVPAMWSMTPMMSYTMFRSARQAKPPCSFRYNPTLSLLLSFTALGQQRFNCYMLR